MVSKGLQVVPLWSGFGKLVAYLQSAPHGKPCCHILGRSHAPDLQANFQHLRQFATPPAAASAAISRATAWTVPGAGLNRNLKARESAVSGVRVQKLRPVVRVVEQLDGASAVGSKHHDGRVGVAHRKVRMSSGPVFLARSGGCMRSDARVVLQRPQEVLAV